MSTSLEKELAEWHRRLSSAKNARRAKMQESERVLASQRGHIEDERNLNKHMQEQLSVDLESAVSPGTESIQQRQSKLQDLIETYSRKVEVESRQLESIQQELELTQAKAYELRRASKSQHAAADETKSAAKTIKVLENRLEQAEKRFGEAIAGNRVLHHEIDEHNKARITFEKVCSKLEQELASKQDQLDLLHTSVLVAEEARAAAVRQLSMARTQEDREVNTYEAELKELQACFGADKELLEAQTKRIEGVVEATENSTARLPSAQSTQVRSPAADSLSSDAVIAWLKQVSSSSSLDALVSHFCQLESLNFHLFEACNQANIRINTLQKDLLNAQADLEHLEASETMGRHKEVTANTLAKRDQALKRAEGLHEKQVLLERRLALVRAGINQALRTLGTSLTPPARPEDPASVYSALLQNLGILETKSRAVLAVYSRIMDRNSPGVEEHVEENAELLPSRSNASIGSRILPAESVLARPPSSVSSKGPRGKPALNTGAIKVDENSSNDDSDGSPVLPLSREQLQAQLYAQNH